MKLFNLGVSVRIKKKVNRTRRKELLNVKRGKPTQADIKLVKNIIAFLRQPKKSIDSKSLVQFWQYFLLIYF